jgi:hypothetical protein
MSDFIEENERIVYIDLEEIPESLTYKIPEIEYTYNPEKFGIGEYLNIEYYALRFERAYPGLLKQFPELFYMVEDWHREATKRTPLEELMERRGSEEPPHRLPLGKT